MYCPRCGHPLQLIVKEYKESELDWENYTKEELDAYLKAFNDPPKREEYICTRNPHPCFAIDYPLYFHHPEDVNRRPGDSWSLSYIK